MTAKDDLLAQLSAAYQDEKTYRARREFELRQQLQAELAEKITITNYLLAKGEAMRVNKSDMARVMEASRSTIYARLMNAPEVVLDTKTEEKVQVEELGFKYDIVEISPPVVRVEYMDFGPDKLTGSGQFQAIMGYDIEEPFLIYEAGSDPGDPIVIQLEADTFYSKHLIAWLEEHNA